MIRIARERVEDLFALASAEARRPASSLPDRYVRLARRIGSRYNVRIPAEYRTLYCRSCSIFWVEGRTVRTRVRSGRRIQTCLRCGAVRRVSLRPAREPRSAEPVGALSPGGPNEAALVGESEEDPELDESEDE